jgi:hypothetical protein
MTIEMFGMLYLTAEICFLVFTPLILAVGFFTVVITLLKLKGTIRMSLQDLTDAAQGVVDEAAALITEVGVVGNSVTAEIARVEAAIAAAKSTGVDPALLDPITAQLATAKTNLANAQAALTTSQQALDAEQAAPAQAPPPTDGGTAAAAAATTT